MPASYTSLVNPRSERDAERELDAAFESDNDDDDALAHESTPLTHGDDGQNLGISNNVASTSLPGTYDFEREYDYPPPGSPPRPSSTALPNDYGNSNGQIPSSPVRPSIPGPSFLRRAVGVILPSHYVQVPTEAQTSRTIGGGIENDGVFANVMAKPQRSRTARVEDGEVHEMPEDCNQKDVPPSYADAQADAVPPYWETTIHAPASLEPGADMIIDDLPTGSFWVFSMNLFISFFFQFIGFLLTYLLHTSHAAKYGSRAGLGLTLIQFGFYSRSMNLADPDESGTDVTSPDPSRDATTTPNNEDAILPGVTSKDWLSFLFMTLGWFLLLSSFIGFWRVKRWEKSIRAPVEAITPEALERDRAIRRNIENVFGISFVEDEETRQARAHLQAQEDARLARDLRLAGLI